MALFGSPLAGPFWPSADKQLARLTWIQARYTNDFTAPKLETPRTCYFTAASSSGQPTVGRLRYQLWGVPP